MNTLALFPDMVNVPQTEGIKYAGSKLKVLPYILSLIQSVQPRRVLDGFSGTTRVAQALSQSGYTVIANDISAWSHVFATCYLLNEYPQNHFIDLIAHLNNLPPKEGWFSEHYGGDAGDIIDIVNIKKPWQKHNTRKLDAIRDEIDNLSLTPIERAVLLTSLIHALDEVDNTLGHFASYLKQWSARSYKTLRLKVPALIPKHAAHQVYQSDIFDVLAKQEFDLAYFDPPYGSNNEKMPPSRVRYAAYYHLWSSVCLNDKPPIFGKAGRRKDSSDTLSASVFEEFRRTADGKLMAVEAIRRLFAESQAKYILLSYSSGGRATAEQLHQVMTEHGRLLNTIELDYRKNVMAQMRWTHEWVRHAEQPHKEFLFLVEKHSTH